MNTTQKTFTPKGGEITRGWRVIDAAGKPLGRQASEIATYLRGKHLATFAEHMDVGDHVIVVNASQLRVTGTKLRTKMYYRHSTYPGGFKAVALGDLLAKHPDRVVKHAVKGMLPHNALGRKQLRKLRVYAGPTHPHHALAIGSLRAADRSQTEAVSSPAVAATTT